MPDSLPGVMIFAAGLGTRLGTFTENVPKALVKIGGMTLLEFQLRRLSHLGFREAVINVHHFADQLIEYVRGNRGFGINVHISDERDELLETGGGLRKAAAFFKGCGDILLINADVITNMDFRIMISRHRESPGLATLAVRNRVSSRYLLFDDTDRLCGWRNLKMQEEKIALPGTGKLRELGFSGIHVIQEKLLELIPAFGKYSIVDSYLRLAAGHCISAFLHDSDVWMDVGRPENLELGEKLVEGIEVSNSNQSSE